MAEEDDGGDDAEEDEGGKPGPENGPPAHMLSVHQHQSTQGHHVPAEDEKDLLIGQIAIKPGASIVLHQIESPSHVAVAVVAAKVVHSLS